MKTNTLHTELFKIGRHNMLICGERGGGGGIANVAFESAQKLPPSFEVLRIRKTNKYTEGNF